MDASYFTTAGQSFAAQEAQLQKLQNELATGTAIDTAEADPAAFVGAQEDASTVKSLSAMDAAQTNIEQTLGTATSALGSMETALDSIQSIALQAMNGTSSSSDFGALGEQVGEGLAQILSLANTQGSDGNYIFAGTDKNTQPFVSNASGSISYVGNDGTSTVEISPGVTVNAALSGSIFTNALSGNGYASVSASSANTGAATVLATGVSNTASATAFQEGTTPVTLTFGSSANGATTYTETSGSSTIASGTVDTSDGSEPTITVGGVQLQLSGTPAAGDTFTVAPARPQSIFDMVQSLQQALTSAGTTTAAKAQTRQVIGNVLGSIVQYQDQIAGASAKAGVVLQATQSAATANATASTSAQNNSSDLVAADMPSVLTQITEQTAALQAAMKAFSTVSQLNLFHYL